jgi:hypothetical protein
MSKLETMENRNQPNIPTSVLLSEVYGELGRDIGWSLERTKFHTDLEMVGDISDNLVMVDYMNELEILIKNNPSSLLTDLHDRRSSIQNEFNQLRALLLRVLRQKTNIYYIDGATNKDVDNSVIHTGIVYFLEDSKVCDSESVNILNTLILGHEPVKNICKNVLIRYAKLIMITDVLVKCIVMAKMTGQVPVE